MQRNRRPGGPRPATIASVFTALLAFLAPAITASAQPPAPADPMVVPDPAPADPDAPMPGVDPTAAPMGDPLDEGPLGPDIPGYRAPAAPDPMLAIEKELLTRIKDGVYKEEEDYKRYKPAFTTAMNDGSLVGDNRKVVADGIAYLILRMSLKKHRGELADMRAEVERWIRNAAMKRGVKPNARLTFRSYMCDRIIENCEKLLDGNLNVRWQAMLLLNKCVIMPVDPFKKTPEEFYVPTYEVFLRALADREQHMVVRIWAAKGLQRVLDRGVALRNAQRQEIADAMMRELLSGENEEWLDMRIAEAGGDIGIVRFGGAKPVVIDGLSKVLNDSSRSALVRAEAAKQLGRTKFDPNANLSLFAQQTVRLVHEMALEQAKDPNSSKRRVGILKAYLAFVPRDRDEMNAKDAGLLVRARKPQSTGHAEYVEDALNQIVPFANHMIGNDWQQPFKDADVKQLESWLESHPPADTRAMPDLDPLDVKRVAETPPAGDPAG